MLFNITCLPRWVDFDQCYPRTHFCFVTSPRRGGTKLCLNKAVSGPRALTKGFLTSPTKQTNKIKLDILFVPVCLCNRRIASSARGG